MIYEVSLLDTRLLYLLPWFAIIMIFWRYISRNELLSKKDKIKAVCWAVALFGTIPTLLLGVFMWAKLSLVIGHYDVFKGQYKHAIQEGRYISLIVGAKTFKFGKHRVNCLSHIPIIEKGTELEIKYSGNSEYDCIMAIRKI